VKKDLFRKIATDISEKIGSTWTFIGAFVLVFVWAITGPFFNFSTIWQLVINTVTNIVAFLMLFILQYTQNRDTKATQLKLDELLRAVKGAKTSLSNIEDSSDEELDKIKESFKNLSKEEENKN
jgi:low affinity Fe/Cu permease